ncbi:MAG TPA: hypothetical protein VLO07_00620 [Thermoanaerobaculia bacterium]|nr:hypothetical protein [Thermoanaerobaculia bacterium]
MGRLPVALILLALSAVGAARGDAASEATRGELARDRKRLTTDSRSLADISRRLESALTQLASSSRALADVAGRSDVSLEELIRREDAVAETEQEVRTLLERRRLLADRLVERRRSIAALEAELVAHKPSDLVSGRWTVLLDPGEQRGVFRMTLDGTIVSGEYTLEGGYSGSLRGTLVEDLLRLERVDSRLGFSAVFYGRVAREGSIIAGTWETTNFGGGSPGGGRWKAVREEEREETP